MALSTNGQTLMFDVYAATDGDWTAHVASFLDITYNPLAFDIASISDIGIDYNEDLFSPDIYFQDVTGFIPGEIQTILADIESTPIENLAYLRPTPQRIFTMTLKVADCNQRHNIGFSPPAVNENIHVYDPNNGPLLANYNPLNFEEPPSVSICGCEETPVISSFSPQQITAGTNSKLTILGSGFGVFRPGVSKVQFTSPDGGWINAAAVDFEWDGVIHWSDDRIDVIVPSVDAGVVVSGPAGSGPFRIINMCGVSPNSAELLVPYAHFNFRQNANTPARFVVPVLNSGEAVRNLKILANSPNWLSQVVRDAVDNWCSSTHIDIRLDSELATSTSVSEPDLQNVVRTVPSSGQLVRARHIIYTTSVLQTGCFSLDAPDGFLYKIQESDYEIFTGGQAPDPFAYDQYVEELSHELGHGFALDHAWRLEQLMHPNGNSAGVPNTWDIEGAISSVALAQQLVTPACGRPLVFGGCGTNPTLESSLLPPANWRLFPNPANSGSNFVLESSSEPYFTSPKMIFNLVVRDIVGREIWNGIVQSDRMFHVPYLSPGSRRLCLQPLQR